MLPLCMRHLQLNLQLLETQIGVGNFLIAVVDQIIDCVGKGANLRLFDGNSLHRPISNLVYQSLGGIAAIAS